MDGNADMAHSSCLRVGLDGGQSGLSPAAVNVIWVNAWKENSSGVKLTCVRLAKRLFWLGRPSMVRRYARQKHKLLHQDCPSMHPQVPSCRRGDARCSSHPRTDRLPIVFFPSKHLSPNSITRCNLFFLVVFHLSSHAFARIIRRTFNKSIVLFSALVVEGGGTPKCQDGGGDEMVPVPGTEPSLILQI